MLIIKCHEVESSKSTKLFKKHGDFWWHFMINLDVVKPIHKGSILQQLESNEVLSILYLNICTQILALVST